MNGKSWYAIPIVENDDQFISKLKDAGFDVFIPSMERIHRKQGVHYKVIMKIFPNYLFVSSDLPLPEFQKWMRSQGLIQCDSSLVKAISKQEKELLTKLMDENYLIKHSTGIIEHGNIQIQDGPLQGFEDSIIKIDRHKRIAILNPMLLETQLKVSLEITKKI